jgi:hypothetical protein
MARTPITADGESLVDDSGTVLWSFIRGEQLEFPVKINFLTDCTTGSGYVFEACILEAGNVSNQTAPPDTLEPAGIKTDLTVANGGVRQLVDLGTWSAAGAYNAGEVVLYSTKYYYLLAGVARVSATLPTVDPMWIETTKNTIFLRFASTLGADFSIKPKIGFSTYGFFELSVREPATYAWRRVWKPVRGMIELLYSPLQTPVDP